MGMVKLWEGRQRGYQWLGAALAAVVMPVVIYQGGMARETVVVGTLFLLLVVLTVTDLKSMLMPNRIVFPAFGVLLVLRFALQPELWREALAGLVVGGLILTLLGLCSNGMGGGDVKVFALIGLVVGVKGVLFAIFYSSLYGTLIGLPLRWTGRIKPRQHIPFGPFILLGTLTAWACGDRIWHWYLMQLS
ncbi:hypothetical protein CIG75_08035 [Tumebacillus algifaecis]|uniref:Prepilin type IV endopeptidase peptidase domain-containing protein n=1 Tax=Tumebacillus algifaecis TaxID=1214604 RepID=A0A223D0U8_9BACL|nr:A24 family peptidase [Tumebacillus algifaecis]ASS74936.1 hypothetical protein CIG75_08035 [Tumebacillus algifaecis]